MLLASWHEDISLHIVSSYRTITNGTSRDAKWMFSWCSHENATLWIRPLHFVNVIWVRNCNYGSFVFCLLNACENEQFFQFHLRREDMPKINKKISGNYSRQQRKARTFIAVLNLVRLSYRCQLGKVDIVFCR